MPSYVKAVTGDASSPSGILCMHVCAVCHGSARLPRAFVRHLQPLLCARASPHLVITTLRLTARSPRFRFAPCHLLPPPLPSQIGTISARNGRTSLRRTLHRRCPSRWTPTAARSLW